MSIRLSLALVGGLLLAAPAAADPARTLPNAHPRPSGQLRFSPDGTRLASTGRGKDAAVKLWDPATGTLVGTLTGRLRCLDDVRFSPDGRLVVTDWSTTDPDKQIGGVSPEGSEVILWSAETGKRLYTLKGKYGGRGTLAFSPDGKVLLINWWESDEDPKRRGVLFPPGASEAVLYAVETGKPIATLPGTPREHDPRYFFLNDGRLLASRRVPFAEAGKPVGSLDLAAWDPATGRKLDPVRLTFPDPAVLNWGRTLYPFPDRNWVAVAAEAPPGCRVRFLAIEGNEGRPVPGGEFPVGVPTIGDLGFSPDGRRAAASTYRKEAPLVVADIDPAGRVTRARESFDRLRPVWLADVTRDRRLVLTPPRVLDLDSGKMTELDPWGDVMGTISPDGRWVATIDADGTIRLWDISRATVPKK